MENIRPHFETALYRCTVNGRFFVKKFHLSGLLFFKNFSDTATRVVFQNEMGITYFDFGWDAKDSFRVNFIIDKMNKPALIKTLKKDFDLLFLKQIDPASQQMLKNKSGQDVALRFRLEKGFAYYFLNEGGLLKSIANADEQRKVVVMDFDPPAPKNELPQHAELRHLRACFSISLQKLSQNAVE